MQVRIYACILITVDPHCKHPQSSVYVTWFAKTRHLRTLCQRTIFTVDI